MMRRGRLAYIRSYWARQADCGEVLTEMGKKHIAELIAEVERLWNLYPHEDPPLDRPDHVRKRENGCE